MGSKLKSLHVVIIGVVACVLVVGGIYFFIIKKQNEQLTKLNNEYQTLSQEYAKLPSVKLRLETARQNNRIITVKYDKYLSEKMPPLSFQNRAQGMIALWKEQSEILGPLLQSWPAKTGVTLTSGVQVPAAPADPNAIDPTMITIPIGNFTVKGDFTHILSHLRSWNKMNRLVKIDVGKLTGPSPGMTVEYTVTVYIFPRGEAGQNIAMAGAGVAGAGPMPGAPAPMAAPSSQQASPSGPTPGQSAAEGSAPPPGG